MSNMDFYLILTRHNFTVWQVKVFFFSSYTQCFDTTLLLFYTTALSPPEIHLLLLPLFHPAGRSGGGGGVNRKVISGSDTTKEEAWVYQSTMPCLSCLTQLMMDGWVHLLNNSSWKFHQLAAGQLLLGQLVRYGKDSLSITYKITPAESLSSSQPGGPPCWASPLAFGLIGYNPLSRQCTILLYVIFTKDEVYWYMKKRYMITAIRLF